jgi:hypothetical protein
MIASVYFVITRLFRWQLFYNPLIMSFITLSNTTLQNIFVENSVLPCKIILDWFNDSIIRMSFIDESPLNVFLSAGRCYDASLFFLSCSLLWHFQAHPLCHLWTTDWKYWIQNRMAQWWASQLSISGYTKGDTFF